MDAEAALLLLTRIEELEARLAATEAALTSSRAETVAARRESALNAAMASLASFSTLVRSSQ
jgi:cell division septum initiation protein DivIVA